jgi:deferrochelatase/peroxidase EfeB
MNLNRRNFLSGTVAGAAGTVLAGGVLIGGARADAQAAAGASAGDTPATAASYPFHGAHQAGVLTPGPAAKQPFCTVAAFDSMAATRQELEGMLRGLTARARFLTSGGTPQDRGVGAPPSDSEVLGPVVPADGLTLTVGVGASLFDERYGLAARKPARLTPMRVFPDDALEAPWRDGDLLIQFCANNKDTVHHAIRDITRYTRGGLRLRWKLDGYGSPPRPSGTPRNLLGFKDGTANPVGATADNLVWVDKSAPGEPAWAHGGSYQVVRLIRMLVEFWDRVSIREQENMFGRRRDSGAPLDGSAEFDTPDYAKDARGAVIPLDSHMRLANPRTPATDRQRLIRRSYNYDLGVDLNGNLQAGHVFICYQQDVKRQFEAVQERLAGEPLTDYVQPFGGGYFFVLPGVRDTTDWYGSGLLA